MSYDIELIDPVSRTVLELDNAHTMRGGTYCIGGSNEAKLNVTYNYSPHYRRVMGDGGIRSIYGKSGAESIPILTAAIGALGDEVNPDYWTPTEGNAKRALVQLRTLAQMRPDGIWSGD